MVSTLRSVVVSPLIKVFKRFNPEWNPCYTSDYEVEQLLKLLRFTTGTYLEIGCNEGRTLAKIAAVIAPRKCIGVDCSTEFGFSLIQGTEQPTPDRLGIHAKHLPNVRIIDCDSKMLRINELVGFCFIDGDHSYFGVEADTELAFKLVKSGIIAWHDVNKDAPAFVKVRKFLEDHSLPFIEIANTKIGFVVVPSVQFGFPRFYD